MTSPRPSAKDVDRPLSDTQRASLASAAKKRAESSAVKAATEKRKREEEEKGTPTVKKTKATGIEVAAKTGEKKNWFICSCGDKLERGEECEECGEDGL